MATNPTLPGVRVTLSDSYYSANDTNPDAARVLLIAKAAEGASVSLYNPILYTSEQHVLAKCGAGSDAHVAFVQAIRSGANNVYVSCVDPTKMSTVAEREAELKAALDYADGVEPDIIVAFGFFANEVVPGVGAPVNKNVTAINGVTGEAALTLTATAHGFAEGDHITLAGVAEPNDGLNGAYVVDEVISANRFTVTTAAPLGGDVTLSALTGVTATKGASGSRLVDNAKNLGLACHRLMRDMNPVFGVIAMQPIAQDAPTAIEIQAYTDLINGTVLADLTGVEATPLANVVDAVKSVVPEEETTAVDLGRYLVPCAGKVIVRGQPNVPETAAPGFTSCEAVVAGQIYSTPLEDAITASPITNVVDISNTFSRGQKLALVAKHMNVVCLSGSNTIVTLDGWTLASPDTTTGEGSVYERLSTVRITNEVIKAFRNELEKFIGMQASTARMNSIETKLRAILVAFKNAGVLRYGEFKMAYSQGSGTLTVDLNLVPFGEMRTVELTVAVKINA